MDNPKTNLIEAINETSVQSSSGLYLDYANPTADQFTILDLVKGLARECRFSGQTKSFYSVAQHSVLVSLAVPKEYALHALFHDGSEAFLRDIATPLKRLLPDYREMEAKIQAIVHQKVGLDAQFEHHVEQAIKTADLAVFAAERQQLMPADGRAWPCAQEVKPFEVMIEPMGPARAIHYFMERHASILYDIPFAKDRELWARQQEDWLRREIKTLDQTQEQPATRVRERAA